MIYELGLDRGVPTSILVQHIFNLAPDDIEGNPNVLDHRIDGDFVLRGSATDDQIRTGLAKVLSDTWFNDVTLTYKDVDTKVYVLHGTWKYHPVDPAGTDPALARSGSFINGVRQPDPPTIHIYSESTQKSYGSGIGGGNGTIKDPKNALFRVPLVQTLDCPVIIEADGIPASLKYSRDDDPSKPSDPKAILDHISDQTGLTWTQETRKLHHLFVEYAQK